VAKKINLPLIIGAELSFCNKSDDWRKGYANYLIWKLKQKNPINYANFTENYALELINSIYNLKKLFNSNKELKFFHIVDLIDEGYENGNTDSSFAKIVEVNQLLFEWAAQTFTFEFKYLIEKKVAEKIQRKEELNKKKEELKSLRQPIPADKDLAREMIQVECMKAKELFPLLDVIIQFQNIELLNYMDIIKRSVLNIYGIVEEQNLSFALQCVKGGINPKHYQEALELTQISPKKWDYIPDVKITSDSGYVLETMPFNDPMTAILGKVTSCCQSLDGDSRDCVLQGMSSHFGGFIKITRPASKGDPWIAQSWIGLAKRLDGKIEAVLDSIEHNRGHSQAVILDLFEKAAQEIIKQNPNISRVVFGGGGNTPKNHSYKPVEEPESGYTPIIGYAKGAYDSKKSRFLLANNTSPKGTWQIGPRGPRISRGGFVLSSGTDTYANPGKKLRGVSLNVFARANFFAPLPKTEALLRGNNLNPVMEEGYYGDKKLRERFGEYFLPFTAFRPLIDEKIMKRAKDPTSGYKVNTIILVDNDESKLAHELKQVKLQDGENILVGFVTGIHAISTYIQNVHGEIRCLIIDPQDPSANHSAIHPCIQEAFPNARIATSLAYLQVDFYSCSTFLVKNFQAFAKNGAQILEHVFKDQAARSFAVPAEKMPPILLKMGQKVDFKILSDAAKNTIVSKKKGLTLKMYLKDHRQRFEENGKKFNLAAIEKKYNYFATLGKLFG
jgi:hypothetical protein